MGSRIAAHFANAGFPVLLLDLPHDGHDRNAISRRGVENALSQRPTAFFSASGVKLIEPGNFDDDLSRINTCQWVIEAVTEDLNVKRALWARVDAVRNAEAILSDQYQRHPPA